ncbi:MAG: hypothetical protein JW991_04365 [Candidatus Pacebacteria bacterium]|nr:hypothetical protein [Candidatus Paceibacterota bacterium]
MSEASDVSPAPGSLLSRRAALKLSALAAAGMAGLAACSSGAKSKLRIESEGDDGFGAGLTAEKEFRPKTDVPFLEEKKEPPPGAAVIRPGQTLSIDLGSKDFDGRRRGVFFTTNHLQNVAILYYRFKLGLLAFALGREPSERVKLHPDKRTYVDIYDLNLLSPANRETGGDYAEAADPRQELGIPPEASIYLTWQEKKEGIYSSLMIDPSLKEGDVCLSAILFGFLATAAYTEASPEADPERVWRKTEENYARALAVNAALGGETAYPELKKLTSVRVATVFPFKALVDEADVRLLEPELVGPQGYQAITDQIGEAGCQGLPAFFRYDKEDPAPLQEKKQS